MSSAHNANLSRLLDWNLARRPDHEALVDGDRRWSYAQLHHDVNALAAGLAAHELRARDVVALLGLNSADYLIACLAVSKLGAIFVPLNYRLHEEELHYLLGHSDATMLLADGEYDELAARLVASSPGVSTRFVLAEDAVRQTATEVTVPSVRQLIDAHRGELVPDAVVAPDDLQRILYTSGTTSRPKGAMLTHGNVTWNMIVQAAELSLTPRERVLNFAPMYHVGGLDIPGFGTWYAGATMVVLRRFDPKTILDWVGAERITGMVMVATMVHMIRELPGWERFDTSSVRWMIFSQVVESLYRETQRIFPNTALMEGYGLTETCNGVSYLHVNATEEKLGSVGVPLAHTDLRVVDDADRPVPPGELGEVTVRGPKVSPGYWKDEEATVLAHRGGWFHTGDVGCFDADGYLYIVDRKKDMIRSGGENVASSEIERVLYELDGVSEAAVVGITDQRWGEVPKAFIVCRDGYQLGEDEIIAHCRSRLAGFKTPKVVQLVSALPRNPTGKVLKRELRDW